MWRMNRRKKKLRNQKSDKQPDIPGLESEKSQ